MENELFEKTSIPKAYMKFAIPVVLSCVLTLVYNMVDMFFVAKTQNTNLVAGVSLCGPIFTLLVAMGDILGLGGSSVISRLFGQNKMKDASRLSVFCFWGSVVIGLCVTCILLVFNSSILHVLGATEDTITYASDYLKWIAIGAPIIVFSLTPTNLLRTEGLASQAMIGSITGSIVNMILDPVFIFGFKMGAGGAAIATVLGNVCADIYYIYILTHKSKCLTLSLKGFSISGSELVAILSIGIPSSITNIMSSIGSTVLNRFLLPYGSNQIAAMGIVSRVTMIVTMIMVGFSFGGQPLYGYLYGAKNKERLHEVIRFAYKTVCSLALVASVVLILLAPQMISIFMSDSAIIQTGSMMLRIMLCGMVFIGVTLVTTCIFQSCGNATGSFALSAGRQGYIFIVVMFILSNVLGYTGVLIAQPVSDACTAVLAIVLFKRFFKD